MKEGIKRGMIRSEDDCKAGIDAVKHTYLKISLHGEKGKVVKEVKTLSSLVNHKRLRRTIRLIKKMAAC